MPLAFFFLNSFMKISVIKKQISQVIDIISNFLFFTFSLAWSPFEILQSFLNPLSRVYNILL